MSYSRASIPSMALSAMRINNATGIIEVAKIRV
jgi:hypothetical protein